MSKGQCEYGHYTLVYDSRDACADGHVHGSVVMHGLVAMHVRIAHGLNFMDDWAMWLIYKNGHMQLKNGNMQLKAMQLKVGMQKQHWGKEDQQGAHSDRFSRHQKEYNQARPATELRAPHTHTHIMMNLWSGAHGLPTRAKASPSSSNQYKAQDRERERARHSSRQHFVLPNVGSLSQSCLPPFIAQGEREVVPLGY